MAATTAAAAPPPGVGCLAARAVRNWSSGRDFVGAILGSNFYVGWFRRTMDFFQNYGSYAFPKFHWYTPVSLPKKKEFSTPILV